MHLQEHQETISKLRESVSDKVDELPRIQGDLVRTHVLEAQVFLIWIDGNWSQILCVNCEPV